ncbi:MAG TPA: GntR family transcriptional regulator [Planctomycetota bacterium]|nr:GntR family transcriptional regulator [Planctomycetota bacterium]
MPPGHSHRSKASPKQDAIARFLRSQIISGALAPGARLPTRADLEARFAVSSVTVQRALDALNEHGFINARGTLGTFVVERPPHLDRYALVFFNRPKSDGWLRFYDSLLTASTEVAAQTGHQVTPFFCSPDPAGERDHQRLQRALEAHALAGVIFTSHPYPLDGSPVLTTTNVARVAIMWGDDFPRIPKIAYDQRDFLAQACAWCARHRRKGLALMTVQGQFSTALIDELTALHHLDSPAHWRQTVHPTHAPSARACAHLLVHDGQRQRPDALLVSDDNLVEYALAGLADAGVRVGRDVEVVVHANFPEPRRAAASLMTNVQRLGYDARITLATCVDLIDAQRLGRSPANHTVVQPRFADEAN